MTPSSPRSPPRQLQSPPPSSPPQTRTRNTRGVPSITPRRFRRFFTPRSSLAAAGNSESRRALRDLAGPALNRVQPPSSPLKAIDERRRLEREDDDDNGDSQAEMDTPSRSNKRRKLAHTPPPSSPPAGLLQSSPLPRSLNDRLNCGRMGSLAPRVFDSVDVAEHDEVPRPPPPPSLKMRISRHRGLAMQCLDRELGCVSRPGRVALCYPAGAVEEASHETSTADFCSTSDQVHYNVSQDDAESMCIPFCATGANTNSLVAVGDEEGCVRLLESNVVDRRGFDKIKSRFGVHGNAIIDLSFSPDDAFLATASGDQTGRVTDMTTQATISVLAHHTATVKQIRFQPGRGSNSVLASSSRDGSIQVWDLRCKGGPVTQVATGASPAPPIERGCVVNSIYDGHVRINRQRFPSIFPTSLDTPNRAEITSTGPRQRPGEVSVTAIQFLAPGKEHLLLSACEADASVKLWDIRSIHTSRQKTTAVALSSTAPPESHSRFRAFGMTSLALNGDGSRLYALCKDNTVYTYSTAHLQLGYAPELTSDAPPRRRQVQTESSLGPLYGFRHDAFGAGTFYVKCAVRPPRDGRPELLAVGSSSGSPVLFPTDENLMKSYWEKNRLHEARERMDAEIEARVAGDRYSMSAFPISAGMSFDSALRAISGGDRGRERGRLGARRPMLYRRDSSVDSHATTPSTASHSRFGDTIPIVTYGTPLVRGHEVEVGSVSWTFDGKLITVGDDYSVRCWGESREKARQLRTCGEQAGNRWESGWASITNSMLDDDED